MRMDATSGPRGQTSPQVRQVCLPMNRQHLFCRMPGSQPECLRHSRGKKPLAGQKDGRHFAAGRETGIFPAKSAFAPPVWSQQAKLPVAISTPRFEGSDNPPAGRPRTFAPDRRAIFMEHSVQILSGGDRPADAGNVIGQLAAPAQSRRPESAGLRA